MFLLQQTSRGLRRGIDVSQGRIGNGAGRVDRIEDDVFASHSAELGEEDAGWSMTERVSSFRLTPFGLG